MSSKARNLIGSKLLKIVLSILGLGVQYGISAKGAVAAKARVSAATKKVATKVSSSKTVKAAAKNVVKQGKEAVKDIAGGGDSASASPSQGISYGGLTAAGLSAEENEDAWGPNDSGFFTNYPRSHWFQLYAKDYVKAQTVKDPKEKARQIEGANMQALTGAGRLLINGKMISKQPLSVAEMEKRKAAAVKDLKNPGWREKEALKAKVAQKVQESGAAQIAQQAIQEYQSALKNPQTKPASEPSSAPDTAQASTPAGSEQTSSEPSADTSAQQAESTTPQASDAPASSPAEAEVAAETPEAAEPQEESSTQEAAGSPESSAEDSPQAPSEDSQEEASTGSPVES